MKPVGPLDRERIRHHRILPRFRDAFRGMVRAYMEEPNLRFHLFAATCVALAAWAVGVESWETAYLALAITLVILAELVNTAVERTVDFAAAGRRHPLAGMAKEVAAGAVLLAALHASFAALMIFVINRGVLVTIGAVWHLVVRAPWVLAVPLMAGVAGVAAGSKGRE